MNDAAIGDIGRQRACLIVLRLNAAAEVIECNSFARQLTGTDLTGMSLGQIFVDFSAKPKPIDVDALIGSETPSRVQLPTATGLPVKALFQFIAAAPGEVLAVGWVDVLELIGLQQQLIRFNNEVSAVARATLKESQFAMGRQADTHRRILEAADEGIYALDREGCYSLVNPAAATQLGYRADELLGMNRLDTWRSHDADGRAYPDAECPIADTLANGVPHTDDGRYFQRKDGSIFPVTFSSHPLMDRRRIAGVVVTFRDITRRQQEESAPLRAGGNAGAAKLARRAVLSSISHELRAPMNAILGMADILRRSGLDPLQADCLAKIEMAGNQLLRAVDDMLDRSASEEQPFDDAPAGPGQGTSPAD